MYSEKADVATTVGEDCVLGATIVFSAHAFITIRACCKRLKEIFPTNTQQVWDIYHAETLEKFKQQVDDLRTWAQQHLSSFALQSV